MYAMNYYAVKDVAVGFSRLFDAKTDAQAIRIFENAIKDDRCEFKTHPEDFSLYRIGTFDEDKGSFREDFAFLADANSVKVVTSDVSDGV